MIRVTSKQEVIELLVDNAVETDQWVAVSSFEHMYLYNR